MARTPTKENNKWHFISGWFYQFLTALTSPLSLITPSHITLWTIGGMTGWCMAARQFQSKLFKTRRNRDWMTFKSRSLGIGGCGLTALFE